MTNKSIIAKAKSDIKILQSNQSDANKVIILNIIEAVRKVCGPIAANSLIKEYHLDQSYEVEATLLN